MSDVAGLIFADSYDVTLEGLTAERTMAAVPFGARYRVIDFPLSNMTNAGILNIGIIVMQKYLSLTEHVGGGRPWDLNRKNSSVVMLPPYSSQDVKSVYENRLEGLQANIPFLKELDERYVMISGSVFIANLDLRKMIDAHIESGARITTLYTRDPRNKNLSVPMTSLEIDENSYLTSITMDDVVGEGTAVSPDLYLIDRLDLISILEETMREGKNSFRRDVVQKMIEDGDKLLAYHTDDPILCLDDMCSYMSSNLDLLNADTREAIFSLENRPIITEVKDSPPTRYGKNAKATNSLIADGVVLEGEVRNSVIFRGVHIKKYAVVENSVVLPDATIGEGAKLNYCILDKASIIQDGRMLSGYITHPFYVGERDVI